MEETASEATMPLLDDDDKQTAQPLASSLGAANAHSVQRKEEEREFESHFTLRIPTSTVRFRGDILRIIDTDRDQFILQQREPPRGEQGADGGDRTRSRTLVKRLLSGTRANRALRVGYALVTLLFLGFLFVVCFQLILFILAAIPAEAGFNEKEPKLDAIGLLS